MHIEMFNGFSDELRKIASPRPSARDAALSKVAEWVRSGRRPISVETLLENSAASEKTPSSEFAPVEKTAVDAKMLATIGAGALGYHVLNKANRDRQLGRQMRLQQGG